MKCINCGSSIHKKNRFCPVCGEKLTIQHIKAQRNDNQLYNLVKTAGDSAISLGIIQPIIGYVLLFLGNDLGIDYGFFDLTLACSIAIIMVILGKRIRQVYDPNIGEYIKTLIILSIIIIILGLFTGSKPGFLFIFLLYQLFKAKKAFTKIKNSTELSSKFKLKNYWFKTNHWWVFGIISFFLIFIASGIDSISSQKTDSDYLNSSKLDQSMSLESSKKITSEEKPTPTAQLESEEESTTDILLNVIQALDYYNFATKSVGSDADVISLTSDLMDAQKRMRQGDSLINAYLNSTDEYVSVTAQGMTLGSKIVQESTENLIQYLRNIDENDPESYRDLQYQTAKYLSDNKEGYKLIAISAPQITSLLWDAASSDNTTGPIPYRIPKKQRQVILDKIEDLFADDFQEYYSNTDNYNAIVFSVIAIKNNIEPDTYEEASN